MRGQARQSRLTAAPGSFDLLEALRIPVDLGPDEVARCLDETGVGFIFARRFHPVMKNVAAARTLAGRRTIFNLAGPLSNPTRVSTQVVGTPTVVDAQRIASTLQLLGRERALAITGHSGLDDVDLSGPVTMVRGETPSRRELLVPKQLGLPQLDINQIPGGDAGTNADLFQCWLEDTAPDSLRDVVCLSAAIALWVSGRSHDVAQGYERARALVSSGQVREVFERYRECAQRVASGRALH